MTICSKEVRFSGSSLLTRHPSTGAARAGDRRAVRTPSPVGRDRRLAAAVIEVAEVFFWISFLRRYPVKTGAEGLVGARAEVIDRCAPLGRVRLRGEIWKARSEEPLELGAEVRVEAVDGLTLVMARASNATSTTALGAPPP